MCSAMLWEDIADVVNSPHSVDVVPHLPHCALLHAKLVIILWRHHNIVYGMFLNTILMHIMFFIHILIICLHY